MNKIEQLIDINTNQADSDKILKELITRKLNNDFRDSFEQKLKNKRLLSPKSDSQRQWRIIPGLKKSSVLFLGAIAASFLLLVIVNISETSSLGSSSLAAQYLTESVVAHPGVSRSITNSDAHRTNAALAFNNGDYQIAIQAFEKLPSRTTQDKYYLGVSHLKTGNYVEAISNLYASYEHEMFREESQYFLIIAHVLNDDLSRAQSLRSRLSETDYKYEELQRLLNSVK